MVEMWQQPQPGPQQTRPGELPEGVTLTGYVKVFRQEKGFGFITADCGGPDVFVHKNQLQGGSWLQEGMQVAFQCRMNPLRGKFEVTTCSGPLAGHQGGHHPQVQNERPAAGPSDNLFVADLPPGFSEEQIKEVFGQYGLVRQVKVLANQPNHSRVAALVRFADINQARWVVENLDGNIPLGLSASIKVRFAGVRPGDRQFGFSGGCCGGGKGGAHLLDHQSLPCGQGNGGGCGGCGGCSVPIGGDRKVASAGTFAAALGALLPMVSQHSQALQGIRALQQSGAGAHLAGTIGPVGSNAAAAALGIDLAAVSAAAVTVAAATQSGNQAPVAATPGTTSGTTVMGLTSVAATSAVAASATSSWIQAADPSTGRMYYFNSGTGESRWDRPPELGGEAPS
eukprot:TRINITY_DN48887_c0_g1_i1.p1 TRINITY_DN48887_c0_g1~~TRINITY_DN48887_c0_g1_i1.p1  ORF type:complete len:397 (-),score=76.06 TRINITY_DN48887_c0_g1_i1:362-1552(-)